MKKLSFYDAKPYDREYFSQLGEQYDVEILYHEVKLSKNTTILSKDCDAVCAFVNDELKEEVLKRLYDMGIRVVALRCAGYNNVDFKYAFGKIHIVRVPAYSPYAVAEHAMGLLLCLNRKLHRAHNRTREFNFSINGLTGFDLHEKCIGVIGTGKIGSIFMDICKGFGMKVLAYDPYPNKELNVTYVGLDELCQKADIISLHCPLTKESHHLINKERISKMKDGVYIINTSRGALIESEDLLEGIKSGKIGAAGLDVYEEENELFFEDFSNTIIQDDVLSLLLSLPNVIVTSHQAYLTKEALANIAETTMDNLQEYFNGEMLTNEICYRCAKEFTNCQRKLGKPCF